MLQSPSPKTPSQRQWEKAVLECCPISGHKSVCWYQQALWQDPRPLSIMKRHRETKETSLIASQLNNSMTIALSWTWAPLQLGDLASCLYTCSLAQPCKVPGFLYSNLPVPAEDTVGRRRGLLTKFEGCFNFFSNTLAVLLSSSQSTPEHSDTRFTEHSCPFLAHSRCSSSVLEWRNPLCVLMQDSGAGEDSRVPWTAKRSNQSILQEINHE